MNNLKNVNEIKPNNLSVLYSDTKKDCLTLEKMLNKNNKDDSLFKVVFEKHKLKILHTQDKENFYLLNSYVFNSFMELRKELKTTIKNIKRTIKRLALERKMNSLMN